MENGASFTADIFIDSSYEGDLMAQAGISYTWGREASGQYGESLAGVRGETPMHQFTVNVSARDASGKLLPEIYDQPPGQPGAADRKVQAYNFRMCFSDDPADQVRFSKPAGYTPKRYELLARLLKARTEAEGSAPKLSTLLKIDRIENHKADVNNNGAFSTDYLGGVGNIRTRPIKNARRSGRRTETTLQVCCIFWPTIPACPPKSTTPCSNGVCPKTNM